MDYIIVEEATSIPDDAWEKLRGIIKRRVDQQVARFESIYDGYPEDMINRSLLRDDADRVPWREVFK